MRSMRCVFLASRDALKRPFELFFLVGDASLLRRFLEALDLLFRRQFGFFLLGHGRYIADLRWPRDQLAGGLPIFNSKLISRHHSSSAGGIARQPAPLAGGPVALIGFTTCAGPTRARTDTTGAAPDPISPDQLFDRSDACPWRPSAHGWHARYRQCPRRCGWSSGDRTPLDSGADAFPSSADTRPSCRA